MYHWRQGTQTRIPSLRNRVTPTLNVSLVTQTRRAQWQHTTMATFFTQPSLHVISSSETSSLIWASYYNFVVKLGNTKNKRIYSICKKLIVWSQVLTKFVNPVFVGCYPADVTVQYTYVHVPASYHQTWYVFKVCNIIRIKVWIECI